MSKCGSWSGDASVTLCISRTFEDGKLVPISYKTSVGAEIVDLELLVTGFISHTPGNYSGKPENCYEEETECYLTGVQYIKDGLPSLVEKWTPDMLTLEELDKAEGKLYECARHRSDYGE